MKTHKVGSAFGNMLITRYLKNTKLLKNAYSPEELKKFERLVGVFKKYSEQYSFEYLMMGPKVSRNPSSTRRRAATAARSASCSCCPAPPPIPASA